MILCRFINTMLSLNWLITYRSWNVALTVVSSRYCKLRFHSGLRPFAKAGGVSCKNCADNLLKLVFEYLVPMKETFIHHLFIIMTHPSWINSSKAAHSDTSWGHWLRRATKDRMGNRSSAPLTEERKRLSKRENQKQINTEQKRKKQLDIYNMRACVPQGTELKSECSS